MTSADRWANGIIDNIKRIREAVQAGFPPATGQPGSPGAGGNTVQGLNPQAVVAALAEAAKTDNADVRNAAIRFNQIAAKYPGLAA